MVPVFIWVILMHYMDMYFNMMPEIHPDGPSPAVADLGALLLIEEPHLGFHEKFI